MWKSKDKVGGIDVGGRSTSGLRHMDIAMAELGQREVAGSTDNPRIVEYFTATSYHASDDETPWCAAFTNWVLMQASIARTKSAAALSFADWGMSIKQPKYGDVVVINRGGGRGHVGFFVGFDKAGRIGILGGNQNNEVNISWFSDDVDYQFRRERSLANTTTGKIAIGTGSAIGAVAAAKVVLAPPASAVATKVEQVCSVASDGGFDADVAISSGLALVQFLQGIPMGGNIELAIGAIGAVLVALERSRKLRKVNN